MENKLQIHQNQGLQNSQSILPQRVISEQPNKAIVQAEIAALLERIVVIYQIANWSEKNAVLLSEWIIDNYKFDKFETVKKCLLNPPVTNTPNWRLTPDTIREWMGIFLEEEAIKREQELSKVKTKQTEFTTSEDLSDETKAMIQDYINSLSGFKQVQAMSDADVKKYGRERPVQKLPESLGYVPPDKEYLIEKELRRRWALEVFDKVTGKANENYLSFEEWRLL